MILPNVLMVGAGEYTTGFVHDDASGSDKAAGVVALTLFDLRRRGLVGELSMAAVRGSRFPAIRDHLRQVHADVYRDLDVSFTSFPGDDVASDPAAYLRAVDRLKPGDLVTIFTPDDQHFPIALAAIERGLHTLVAKPLVRTLAEHFQLIDASRAKNVLTAVELHKRWDPLYANAHDRIGRLGDFSFFSSYMSQPKQQLHAFRNWAGKSSDISYYLNAHHVDFNVWAVRGLARPVSVCAVASTGVARSMGMETEDSITLCTQWQNIASGALASAVYTASWIAPPSDVHSQQRFFYMGTQGELQIDQAHRGYSVADDDEGYLSPNPLFMKYTPNARGQFAGQSAYGYRSIEAFVLAAAKIADGEAVPADFRDQLALADDAVPVTAILEAGRLSLDHGGQPAAIEYDPAGRISGLRLA